MTDKPDFRELVGGDDLTPEEAARLERVHEMLVAAGPPPELPPRLAEPEPVPREDSPVAFLPRRRTGLALALAAALVLVSLVLGYVVGARNGGWKEDYAVKMHGTAAAASATATIHVGELDSAGNWPLKVDAKGLKPLPKGAFYEMFLTRNGRPVASCGTFRSVDNESIRLNAPYILRTYDGWVVTRENPSTGSHTVLLRTNRI
jgi:hypothetical protein